MALEVLCAAAQPGETSSASRGSRRAWLQAGLRGTLSAVVTTLQMAEAARARMRPNWFFAFPVEGKFVLDLPAPPHGFRRYHPDDVHLTLAFLGGCGEAAALQALDALDGRLRELRPAPLEVSLGEVVAMGSKRKYSALSALLSKGRAETEACIGALRDAPTLAANGRKERRAQKAHVTLARPFRAKESERKEGLAWAQSLALDRVHARLDRIALYTWSATRRERLFQIVVERSLG